MIKEIQVYLNFKSNNSLGSTFNVLAIKTMVQRVVFTFPVSILAI